MPQIMDTDNGTVSGNHAMLSLDLLCYGQTGCFARLNPRSPQRDTCSALNNGRLSKKTLPQSRLMRTDPTLLLDGDDPPIIADPLAAA